MDILDGASEYLDSFEETFCSKQIAYTQSNTSVSCTAVLGSTVFRYETEDGVTMRTQSVDFLISVESLADITPQKGDVITMSGKTFEVLQPNNEPCWRYTDGYCRKYRIHTKAEDY